MFLQDSGELEPKLQALVTELSEGLGSLVRRAAGPKAGDEGGGSVGTSLAGERNGSMSIAASNYQ